MAVTADLDVVNIALARIGEDELTDLNQAGKVARVMRGNYSASRDSLLRGYRWNFATVRTSLAASGTAPVMGFLNAFPLPDDCLSLIGIYDSEEEVRNYTSTRQPYKVEGRNLLYGSSDDPTGANTGIVYIFYTQAVTNARLFDPLFVDALAWKLGMDCGYAITTGVDIIDRCAKGFKEVMKAARFSNAIEGSPEVITTSEWLDARAQPSISDFRAGPIIG